MIFLCLLEGRKGKMFIKIKLNAVRKCIGYTLFVGSIPILIMTLCCYIMLLVMALFLINAGHPPPENLTMTLKEIDRLFYCSIASCVTGVFVYPRMLKEMFP